MNIRSSEPAISITNAGTSLSVSALSFSRSVLTGKIQFDYYLSAYFSSEPFTMDITMNIQEPSEFELTI